MYEEIKEQAAQAARELLQVARMEPGDIFVVGCSSSEAAGQRIGTASSVEIARAIFQGIYGVLKPEGIYLAAQCCEHLGRALIVESGAVREHHLTRVNVIPQPKAGGSFATAAYEGFEQPVAVEAVSARAGMDIGGTLIGMHLIRVAVPVRLSLRKIGEASLAAARTRPKFVGGSRAVYDESLM